MQPASASWFDSNPFVLGENNTHPSAKRLMAEIRMKLFKDF
jgi:hypothetical protein